MTIRIGVSGWRYPRWRKDFYPRGLAQRKELTFIGETFTSVELNGSFYSLQRPESFIRWHAETPDDFVFAVKGGRFITHMKKLRNVESALANFFAQGLLALGDKLGPVLWQLPERFELDEGRLRDFFALLPRTRAAAAKLAMQHDGRLDGRAFVPRPDTPEPDDVVRHALEVRHESYRSTSFVRLLQEAGVALVVADTAGRFPAFAEQDAGFVYVRLHGETQLYTSGYEAESITRWARRVRRWSASGRDVYVYFDNDAQGHAPFDALALAEQVGAARISGSVGAPGG